MRAKGQPGVVGDVQPLVRVGRPRVGALDAGDEVAEPRRDGRPEPERTIDVQPGSRALDGVGDLQERIERARVHVPGLRADDRRPVRVRQRSTERRCVHPASARRPGSLRSGTSRCRGSGAPRPLRAAPRPRAPGCAARPGCRRGGCPSRPREHVMPRRRERGHVRHLAAGDEGGRDMLRQAEQLAQPISDDLLDHACSESARFGPRSDPRPTSANRPRGQRAAHRR